MFFLSVIPINKKKQTKPKKWEEKSLENPFPGPEKKTAASQSLEEQQQAQQDEANLQGVPWTTFKSCQRKSRRGRAENAGKEFGKRPNLRPSVVLATLPALGIKLVLK